MATFSPTPPASGKVVGRFLVAIGDGIDSDVLPDGAVPTGTITFTPTVTKVLVANGSPDPFTYELQPITATLDSSGYLTFNGQPGVWLVATNDTNINPPDFNYTVQYNISYAGGVIDKSKFDIKVPASNPIDPSSWTDLTKASTVPSSAGNAIIVGPAGPVTDLTIGTVTTGNPSATITGVAPNKVLNLVLPNGATTQGTITQVNGQNPDNLGHVTLTAALVGAVDMTQANIGGGFAQLDSGARLPTTIFPNLTSILPAGMVMFNTETSGTYPLRPTSRSDIKVLWFGPDQPTVVSSGTNGMLNGVDSWFQTS